MTPTRSGSPTIVPYLIVEDVEAVIAFAAGVLGARERERTTNEDGVVRHVEMTLGDAVLMAGKTSDRFSAMPACLYVYVDDVDASYAKALEAGCTSVKAPADQEYGHRNGGVADAQGNQWWFGAELATG